MSLIVSQALTRRRAGEEEGEPETSPVKTVLGSLPTAHAVASRIHPEDKDLAGKVPLTIEQVPFRRQDRRILNARNRRLMDKKLILFLVGLGLLLILVGGGVLVLNVFYQQQLAPVRPFIVIGPVLAGAGLFSLLFSVEVCVRLRRSQQRVQDPDLDNLVNIHEIKHWIEPRYIPFGWGLFKENKELDVIQITPEEKRNGIA